jgi:hypothetical protein
MKILVESRIWPTTYDFDLTIDSSERVNIKASGEMKLLAGNIQVGIELIDKKASTPIIELEIQDNKVILDKTYEIELDENDKEELVIRMYEFEFSFKKLTPAQTLALQG